VSLSRSIYAWVSVAGQKLAQPQRISRVSRSQNNDVTHAARNEREASLDKSAHEDIAEFGIFRDERAQRTGAHFKKFSGLGHPSTRHRTGPRDQDHVKKPHTHDLGVEEVSRLRKFLKEAGPDTHRSGVQAEEPAQPGRMIVVIDHHAAHVYQDFGGSRPADERKVQPYDPYHFHHHLIHRKEAHYRGERVPEEDSFYEEMAKDITPASEIVLIGHATGKSNAAEFLKEYLKTHHPEISQRVIATENADLSAVTGPEIEALAKQHMIAAA
jgi:hypothetical protein